MKLGVEGVGR